MVAIQHGGTEGCPQSQFFSRCIRCINSLPQKSLKATETFHPFPDSSGFQDMLHQNVPNQRTPLTVFEHVALLQPGTVSACSHSMHHPRIANFFKSSSFGTSYGTLAIPDWMGFWITESPVVIFLHRLLDRFRQLISGCFQGPFVLRCVIWA